MLIVVPNRLINNGSIAFQRTAVLLDKVVGSLTDREVHLQFSARTDAGHDSPPYASYEPWVVHEPSLCTVLIDVT